MNLSIEEALIQKKRLTGLFERCARYKVSRNTWIAKERLQGYHTNAILEA